jgi:hypothetical protein
VWVEVHRDEVIPRPPQKQLRGDRGPKVDPNPQHWPLQCGASKQLARLSETRKVLRLIRGVTIRPPSYAGEEWDSAIYDSI